jgi:hypothetical protein
MRGPALQNSIKTAVPAHLWPFKMDENCEALCEAPDGASQFSRYLLETAGSFDQDTNARASAAKLNKNSCSRAFVAF